MAMTRASAGTTTSVLQLFYVQTAHAVVNYSVPVLITLFRSYQKMVIQIGP